MYLLFKVNDLGGDISGGGASSRPAQLVVDEIKAKGGQAVANYGMFSLVSNCRNYDYQLQYVGDDIKFTDSVMAY